MKKAHWERNLVELIRRCATDLPADAELAIRRARRREKRESPAYAQWEEMLAKAVVARRESRAAL